MKVHLHPRIALALVTLLCSAFLFSCGDDSRPALTPTRTPANGTASKPTPAPAPLTLRDARKDFKTSAKEIFDNPSAPDDAKGGPYQLIRYPSKVGPLAAYITPDPKDGRKRPAILWAHGGFGGIGDYYWKPQRASNDQTPRAFLEAGFVVMIPSWCAENDNPGHFELFYGEVDDASAAIDYLTQLPYVDATRIYMAGHSTGGTITLLTALTDTRLRAAFSFGGAPDIVRVVKDGGYGNTPYNPRDTHEGRLRSAIFFVDSLKVPTFYFEGADSAYCPEALKMEADAQRAAAPFQAAIIERGNHFNILRPLTTALAAKLLADTGAQCNVKFSKAEAQGLFDAARAKATTARRSSVTLTAEAADAIRGFMKENKLPPAATFVRVGLRANGSYLLDLTEKRDTQKDVAFQSQGLTVIVDADSAKKLGAVEVDWNGKGFSFAETEDE